MCFNKIERIDLNVVILIAFFIFIWYNECNERLSKGKRMDCKGKILNVLGDSITAGAFTSGEEHTFCSLLRERLGFAEVRNYGSPGSPIAAHIREDGTWSEGGSFYQRALNMDLNADVVMVFGGTNDFGQGDVPLGSFEDRTLYSFYGACHKLFGYLIEAYPNATLVAVTPTHRRDEDNPRGGDGRKPQDVGTLLDYINVIREVAAYYSIPVLDMYLVSGMNPNIPSVRERFCPDGLHFNDAGHLRLADRMEGFLRAL